MENVADSFSYKKLGLKHVTPKCSQNKILAVKNLEKSLQTSVLGGIDYLSGYLIILFILYSFSVIPGGLRTLEPDYIKANVQRRIDYEMGPIEGLASKYDYEKNEWKK